MSSNAMISFAGDKRDATIVVLTAGGINPWMMINALQQTFPRMHVILEQPETKGTLLRRRIRHCGWLNAAGQLATMMVSRFGKRFAEGRIRSILQSHNLTAEPATDIPVFPVSSINDPRCLERIALLQPAVVVTISCRILSKATLAAIPCPVINLHSAINPRYRGQMGAYWALVEGDRENFGATVHLVDSGVDTGGTLYEIRTLPQPGDTMMTYPTLLTGVSVDIMRQAIEDALDGRLHPYAPGGPSKLRFNVPVWAWIYHGLTKGIW